MFQEYARNETSAYYLNDVDFSYLNTYFMKSAVHHNGHMGGASSPYLSKIWLHIGLPLIEMSSAPSLFQAKMLYVFLPRKIPALPVTYSFIPSS
jgi:hypothetical protein